MKTLGRRASRALTLGVIGALVAFGIGGGLSGGPSPPDRARLLAICLIYGICLGFTAAFALPALFGRPRKNSAAWWAMWLAAVPICCFIGGAAALAILIPTGLGPATRAGIIRALFPYAGSALGSVIAVFIVVTTYGYLRERIDSTSIALKTKEHEEAEARRLAAEAQLASLESRIQPHFLFNTLNSIAALVHSDPDGAERMTTQLASLMRSSLDHASTPLVRVDQELDVVRTYLDIERVRFGDRLRYEIDVPDELGAIAIPRLSIQTLVENSVKYAVSTRRDGASIAVRASGGEGRCRLSVEDDGPGFDTTHVPDNHGLSLLRARLALAFGGQASLQLRSTPARTTIGIDVPLVGPPDSGQKK